MQKCTIQNCPGSLPVNHPQLHKTKSVPPTPKKEKTTTSKTKTHTKKKKKSWFLKSPCKTMHTSIPSG